MFIVDKSVKSLLGYGNDLLACKDYESDTFTKFGFLNTITIHSYDGYQKDMTEGWPSKKSSGNPCMIDDSADLLDS